MIGYKDYVNKVFTEKEHFLKDLFSVLFVDIYESLKDGVEVRDKEKIDAIVGFAYDEDLNQILIRFKWSHFNLQSIDRIIGNNKQKWFSLRDAHSMFQKPNLARHQRVRAIREVLEKKYSLKQYEEFGVIAEDIIRFRNTNAHNNGVRNSSQAMVLFAQISLLLKIYPDDLRDKVNGFVTYEKFINHDFKDSIEIISSLSKTDEVTNANDEDLKLNPKSEIETAEINNTKLHDSIEGIVESSDEISQKIKHVTARVENIEQQVSKIVSSVDETSSFIKSIADIKTNASITNNILEKDQSSSSVDSNIVQTEDGLEDAFDGSDEQEVDLEEAADSIQSPTLLTDAELFDNLLDIRNSIDNDMSAKYISFRNWHNILSRSLVDVLVQIQISSPEDFKNNSTFQHYYLSEQMPIKVKQNLSSNDLEALIQEAKDFMDEQLLNFWTQIQSVLEQRATPAKYKNNEERYKKQLLEDPFFVNNQE